MIKTKIPFNVFSKVFPSREFNPMYRMNKRIWMIEDDNGSLHIEEHPSLIGYLFFLIVIIVAIPVQFLLKGLSGLPCIWDEFISIYWKRNPLRQDDLLWNQESTQNLLKLTGHLND